jgi:hypothetical protein
MGETVPQDFMVCDDEGLEGSLSFCIVEMGSWRFVVCAVFEIEDVTCSFFDAPLGPSSYGE